MEGEMIIALICIAAVGLFIGYIVLCVQFSKIANEKGYGYGGANAYFWAVFFFGLFGMALIIALPDKTGRAQIIDAINKVKTDTLVMNNANINNTKVDDELPDL